MIPEHISSFSSIDVFSSALNDKNALMHTRRTANGLQHLGIDGLVEYDGSFDSCSR